MLAKERTRSAGNAIGPIILAGVLLGGCAISRPKESEEEIQAQRERFIADSLADRLELSRRTIDRVLHERENGEQTMDVLVLSGGGDFGSFGAGYLKGWGEIEDPALTRPVFDAVSGVSTGALIAPFAFVGTDEAIDEAFVLYQNPKKDWFKMRGLLVFLLRQVALVDNNGLMRDVKASMDEEMIAEIAAAEDENRTLLIGTTNLDQGMQRMWNLTNEAERVVDNGDSSDRFFNIIMASATIPGAFPPIEIDGDLYVDGGVTRNIAYTTDQDFEGSVVSIWGREHQGEPFPKVRYWIIVNNQLGTYERTVQPAWPALMGRSLEMSIRYSTLGSLKGLSLATEVMHDGGFDVVFHFVAIPDSWRPPVEGTFKKETMVSLAQLGYEMGKDPASWRTQVPNPESPESNDEPTDD